jgi:hypothetical protein
VTARLRAKSAISSKSTRLFPGVSCSGHRAQQRNTTLLSPPETISAIEHLRMTTRRSLRLCTSRDLGSQASPCRESGEATVRSAADLFRLLLSARMNPLETRSNRHAAAELRRPKSRPSASRSATGIGGRRRSGALGTLDGSRGTGRMTGRVSGRRPSRSARQALIRPAKFWSGHVTGGDRSRTRQSCEVVHTARARRHAPAAFARTPPPIH